MPTATLTFDLLEESQEHLYAIHGKDLALLIFNVLQDFRGIIKYSEDEALVKGVERANEILVDRLHEEGLYNLINQ